MSTEKSLDLPITEDRIATYKDLTILKLEIKNDISSLENRLERKIDRMSNMVVAKISAIMTVAGLAMKFLR